MPLPGICADVMPAASSAAAPASIATTIPRMLPSVRTDKKLLKENMGYSVHAF
jgi:hypothetical protein